MFRTVRRTQRRLQMVRYYWAGRLLMVELYDHDSQLVRVVYDSIRVQSPTKWEWYMQHAKASRIFGRSDDDETLLIEQFKTDVAAIRGAVVVEADVERQNPQNERSKG